MLAGMLLWAMAGLGATDFPEVTALPVTEGLPDPFLKPDGARVATTSEWPAQRHYLLEMLLHYEYGAMPAEPGKVVAESIVEQPRFDGAARLVEFTLAIGEDNPFRMHCGLILPNPLPDHPLPVVVAIEPVWKDDLDPVSKLMVSRGYALAGFEKHDIDDDKGNRDRGVYPHYPGYDWGSIAAWAWGAMRLTDYLVTRPELDPAHIAITGHSRCGKSALLAGALDERFALTAPHCSGSGGAGSFRFQPNGVETLDLITSPTRFYYWFSPRLRTFAGQESRLPFDQHFLKACVAPRALLSLEARKDGWANPWGAQQTHRAALEVFSFLGAEKKTGFFIRPGGHDPTEEAWLALLAYADHWLLEKPLIKPEYAQDYSTFPIVYRWAAPD